MLTYTESDIYRFFDKGNGITNALRKCLSQVVSENIYNQKIDSTFTTMLRAYRESVVSKAVEAARKGRILIVRLPIIGTEDYRLPEIVPYVKVRRKGQDCVIIDISRICSDEKVGDATTGYKVDVPKLYVMMVSAYVALELCGPTMQFPLEAAKHMSILFARVFCQVLNRLGLLTGNRDRAEAFHYFAIKFFLKYYLQAPEPIIETISMGFVGGHKNSLIAYMEDQMRIKQKDPFVDFTTFSQVIYDNEISGIRTQQAKVNDINQSLYVQKFITMYSKNAVIGLWSPDYFFYILLGAFRRTNSVFDKAFDDIFKDNKTAMPKLMDALYKEL